MTVEVLEQLILKEKPDSVLPTLGGQAALNLAMELEEKRILEKTVKLIGTTSNDQKSGRPFGIPETMEKIGEPCSQQKVVKRVEDGY